MSRQGRLDAQRLETLEARVEVLAAWLAECDVQLADLLAWSKAHQSVDGAPPLADRDRDLFREISHVMPARAPFTVSLLHGLTSDHYDLAQAVAAVAQGKDEKIAIGQSLARLDGRWIGPLRVRRGGKEGGVRLWVIEP